MNIEQKLIELAPSLKKTARIMAWKYRGDREEMTALALSSAAFALKNFNPEKRGRGSLESYVHSMVWRALMDDVRNKARRHRLVRMQNMQSKDLDQIADRKSSADVSSRIMDYMDQISDEAMAVADFILGLPSSWDPEYIRKQIRSHFKQRDWEPGRINGALTELRGALS